MSASRRATLSVPKTSSCLGDPRALCALWTAVVALGTRRGAAAGPSLAEDTVSMAEVAA